MLQREREGISFEATCDGNKKGSSLKDFIEEFEQNIYDFENPPPVQIIVQALIKCGDRDLGDNGMLVQQKMRPNMPAKLVFFVGYFLSALGWVRGGGISEGARNAGVRRE